MKFLTNLKERSFVRSLQIPYFPTKRSVFPCITVKTRKSFFNACKGNREEEGKFAHETKNKVIRKKGKGRGKRKRKRW